MKYFKVIDIFETDFKWRSNGHLKYSSFLGIVCSIICFILGMLVVYLFGKDMFLKEKPKIISQNMYPKVPSLMPINKENFNFAFRIENEDGTLFKNNDLISFDIDYVYEEEGETKEVELSSIDCNESNFPKYQQILNDKDSVSNWKCINFENASDTIKNFYFSTSQKNEPLNYLYVRLFGKNALAMQNVLSHNLLIVKIIYPTVKYVSMNLNPLYQDFTYYKVILGSYLRKVDTIALMNIISLDDKGWLYEDVVTTSSLSVDSIISDYTLDFKQAEDENENDSTVISNHDDNQFENESIIYSVIIKYKNSYIQFSRSFLKITELAALVGGFMKCIYFILYILIEPYNKYYQMDEIIREYYDCSIDKETLDKSMKNESRKKSIKR